MKRRNTHRHYNTAYDFIPILFYKIPLIIVGIYFTIPILIIQSCYKDIIFTDDTGKTLCMKCIFFKAKHHHLTRKIQFG